jgi:hypothetical protein
VSLIIIEGIRRNAKRGIDTKRGGRIALRPEVRLETVYMRGERDGFYKGYDLSPAECRKLAGELLVAAEECKWGSAGD